MANQKTAGSPALEVAATYPSGRPSFRPPRPLLDAIEELPIEEQAELVAIVRRRLLEHRREELAAEIQEAWRDFEAGRCPAMTPDEILRDISSAS